MSSDFFISDQPVTSNNENNIMLCDDEVTDDDILYSQPTTYKGSQSHSLCFIPQSVEQLAILKRQIRLLFMRTH